MGLTGLVTNCHSLRFGALPLVSRVLPQAAFIHQLTCSDKPICEEADATAGAGTDIPSFEKLVVGCHGNGTIFDDWGGTVG